MAKTAVKEPPQPVERGALATADEQTRAVAPGAQQLPDFLDQSELEKHAGKGVSQEQADNLIPLIYKLQAQSPQVNDRNPAYLDGAKAGAIWLREYHEPIADGDAGILFQPTNFKKVVIEWIPRDDGGGFVARHDEMPADAVKHVDPKNPNRVSWTTADGKHQLVETREHVGFVHLGDQRLPYVVPMSGADHKVSRGWMTNMNSHRLGSGKVAPPWMLLYRLHTQYRTNTQGEWFGWSVKPAGYITSRLDFDRGTALHEAYESGAKQAQAPDQGLHETEANTGEAGGEGEERIPI
jgi:hypothetical protein